MGTSHPRLRDVDEDLLDLLAEGRVTPTYATERLAADGTRDVSSSYVNQRLIRLHEHGVVENLFDSGLYSLADDPREEA